MNSFENVTVTCTDGYSLSGRFYQSKQSTKNLPILLCPATGITQGFYHNFIEWLTEQGSDVLVFDFRGIGDSLYSSLRDSNASIQDWGLLDIPAAIQTLLEKTGQEQVN